jgi:nitroreductase
MEKEMMYNDGITPSADYDCVSDTNGATMSNSEQTGAMSVAEAIRRKRAVRAYTTDPVPEEVIDAILNAGRRAQSSKNSQPWTFILVSDREQLRQLSTAGTYAAHLANAAFAVVLVGAAGTEFDLGQAAAYMQLAATTSGVGSCVTTLHDQAAAHAVLGVPDELTCRWSIAFGYPAEPSTALKAGGRKPLAEVVRRERYCP